MIFPTFLTPNDFEQVKLPRSGRDVELPKAMVTFNLWHGPEPARYGGKRLLDWCGKCVFAELAILRIFQSDGWDGRWIDTFGHKQRVDYWGNDAVRRVLKLQQDVLTAIERGAGNRNGCFDVFCWRDRELCFAEAKRSRRDRIRDTQRRWIESALNNGLDVSQLLIVEWDVGSAQES